MATVTKRYIGTRRPEASDAVPRPQETKEQPDTQQPPSHSTGDRDEVQRPANAEATFKAFEPDLNRFFAERGQKAETRQLIRGAVRHFARLGFTTLDDLSLEAYRNERMKQKCSLETVRGEMNKLLAFARFLGKKPVVKVPRKTHRAPVAWSRKELAILFRAARSTKRSVYGLPGNVYYPAIISVCIDTGERIGAITRVKWGNVNWDDRTIIYPAEIRKGGYRDSVGQLSRGSINFLRALQAAATDTEPDDPIFGLGHRSTLWRAYGRFLADCGLPNDRKRSFHCFRRTAASNVHRAGGDATAFLGHSSDSITRESYLAPSAFKPVRPWRPGGWREWLPTLFGK